MQSKPTCTVLFSGGGGVEAGLLSLGIDCVQRVELDPDIAAVNEDNFGPGVICAPVQSVDLSRLSPTEYLWASPPCQGASVARSKKLAPRDDDGVGIHVLDYVRALRPRAVCLENVPPYQHRPVFHAILHGLRSLGYRTQWRIVNSADHGVPQTRKRLIMRAVREGETLLPLTPTHAKEPEADGLFGPALLPWNGWYGAIEDILHTLPESAFAPWQIKRLPKELFGSFLSDACVNTAESRLGTCRTFQEPAFTIIASAMRRPITTPKAYLVGGANTSDVQAAPGVGVSHAHAPTRCVAKNAASWKSLLVEGDAAGDRPPTCGTSAEPSFTLKTDGGGRVHRAFLCGVQGEAGELARDGVPPSPTITTAHDAAKYRAFIADGQNARESETITVRQAGEPVFAITHGNNTVPRARLTQGRVVSMTPRALARFQSFPDSYRPPESKSLASKIIGNSVPPLLAAAIGRTLPGMENPHA